MGPTTTIGGGGGGAGQASTTMDSRVTGYARPFASLASKRYVPGLLVVIDQDGAVSSPAGRPSLVTRTRATRERSPPAVTTARSVPSGAQVRSTEICAGGFAISCTLASDRFAQVFGRTNV